MQSDREFATAFAEKYGDDMVRLRATTGQYKKFDRTDVTDLDVDINAAFIGAVRRREGKGTSVRGEEGSNVVRGARRVWVIDPVDGTGELVDDSKPDHERTSCLALALFVGNSLVLSVVRNPFRHETFVATQGEATTLNGKQIRCKPSPIQRGVPYDFCHWNKARFDMRRLEPMLGKPRGVYSAIYQACEVAAGRSAFAVFPGDTIHDIAPAALLVNNAGGMVTDLHGRMLDWFNLSRGVIYAARASHGLALRAIHETMR